MHTWKLQRRNSGSLTYLPSSLDFGSCDSVSSAFELQLLKHPDTWCRLKQHSCHSLACPIFYISGNWCIKLVISIPCVLRPSSHEGTWLVVRGEGMQEEGDSTNYRPFCYCCNFGHDTFLVYFTFLYIRLASMALNAELGLPYTKASLNNERCFNCCNSYSHFPVFIRLSVVHHCAIKSTLGEQPEALQRESLHIPSIMWCLA